MSLRFALRPSDWRKREVAICWQFRWLAGGGEGGGRRGGVAWVRKATFSTLFLVSPFVTVHRHRESLCNNTETWRATWRMTDFLVRYWTLLVRKNSGRKWHSSIWNGDFDRLNGPCGGSPRVWGPAPPASGLKRVNKTPLHQVKVAKRVPECRKHENMGHLVIGRSVFALRKNGSCVLYPPVGRQGAKVHMSRKNQLETASVVSGSRTVVLTRCAEFPRLAGCCVHPWYAELPCGGHSHRRSCVAGSLGHALAVLPPVGLKPKPH